MYCKYKRLIEIEKINLLINQFISSIVWPAVHENKKKDICKHTFRKIALFEVVIICSYSVEKVDKSHIYKWFIKKNADN